MSPTSISGWIPSPARSNRFRSPGRATICRVAMRRAAICRATTRPGGEQGVARQLNDAIARLDARLSQISNPAAETEPSPRTGSARPTWSSARPLRSIAPRRRSARPRSISRSPKSPRARTNSTMSRRRRGRCRRAARRRWRPRCRPRKPRARISPRSSAICSRSPARSKRCSVPAGRAIDRRLPQRTVGNPSRHHRGDAAPGDRIDRKRNPLAVAPHRRDPPEQQRRPGAGRHRTRLERNPRSAALADAGRTAGGLRRGDPQSRRQARPDPARQRRSLHGAAARRRHRRASRHRLQCRLQRRAGPALRRRARAVRPRSTSLPAPRPTAIPSRSSNSASRR